MEPAIEAAMRARFRRSPPPRAAHGAEAEVVGDAVGEDAVDDLSRWPVVQIRVPLQGSGGGGVVAVGAGISRGRAATRLYFGGGFLYIRIYTGEVAGATSCWASAVCCCVRAHIGLLNLAFFLSFFFQLMWFSTPSVHK
jgi:hypothetical protein